MRTSTTGCEFDTTATDRTPGFGSLSQAKSLVGSHISARDVGRYVPKACTMDKPRWRHDVVGVDDTGDHDEAKANEDRRFCSSACFGSLVDDNGLFIDTNSRNT